MGWVGAGFLATGAAATDDKVSEAAIPFDRRRHGTILGMGAAALVMESQDAVEERGMRGIVELLSSETRNSAYHATRLDLDHVSATVESLVSSAERRFGIDRRNIAPETVFVSHETFTPARGGSASAEVAALRRVFGSAASEIVMSNTKGFTGHPMGVGIEDVIAVKILEHGIVPPVPNFKEVDPDLGPLTLSRGGRYPVKYAIHLAAGFGSQIALTFTRRIPGGLDRINHRPVYQRWLDGVSGYDRAEVEVVKRVLRVVSHGVPPHSPEACRWAWGTAPQRRAPTPGDGRTLGVERAGLEPPAHVPAQAPLRDATFVPYEPAPRAARPPAPPAPAPAPPVVAFPRPAAAPPPVTAPPPAVAAPQAPVQAAAPAATVAKRPGDVVSAKVLEIVAAKTGYPPDMLDMDLDLEADLGVDTVKQAETFAAVREAFSIPRVENLRLREFPTLKHVVQFVFTHRPDLAQAAATSPAPAAVPAQPGGAPATVTAAPAAAPVPVVPAADPVATKVLEIVAAKTGYPPEMLEMELDLEADLGVDTVKQAETFAAVREAFDIPRVENLKLREFPTLKHVVQFVFTHRPDLAQAAARAAQAGVAAAAPPAGEPATAPSAGHGSPPPTAAVSVPGPIPTTPTNPVTMKVLEIVADKTGYPPEMLEMELDLEADLGVDTVKQAETFAAVRAAFDIPRVENLKLREFPTLSHVVQFVFTHRPDLAQAAARAAQEGVAAAAPPAGGPATAPSAGHGSPPPTAAVSVPGPIPTTPTNPVTMKVLEIVADKTGYPAEMLELDLDLEADLGVDTVKQAETFAAVRATFDIPRVENLKLREFPTLRHVVQFVFTHRPDLAQTAAPAAEAPLAQPEVATPVSAAGAAPVAAVTSVELEASRPHPAAPQAMPVENADRAPRRVATPCVRPPIAWCKPTGVTLGPGSRAVVMPDTSGYADALVADLTGRGVTVLVLEPGALAGGDRCATEVVAAYRAGARGVPGCLPSISSRRCTSSTSPRSAGCAASG